MNCNNILQYYYFYCFLSYKCSLGEHKSLLSKTFKNLFFRRFCPQIIAEYFTHTHTNLYLQPHIFAPACGLRTCTEWNMNSTNKMCLCIIMFMCLLNVFFSRWLIRTRLTVICMPFNTASVRIRLVMVQKTLPWSNVIYSHYSTNKHCAHLHTFSLVRLTS